MMVIKTMPAYVCWINKECLQLKNLLIPIKRYQRKATFLTATAFPPQLSCFVAIFSYETPGLLTIDPGCRKKKSEKVEFSVDILNNTQISRPTIYLRCPNLCLFCTRVKCVEIAVMTLSVEAYLRAAQAMQKFWAPKRGEGKQKTCGAWWSLERESSGSVPLASAQILLGAEHWSQSLPSTAAATGRTQKKREIKKSQVRIYRYTRIISYSRLQQITS